MGLSKKYDLGSWKKSKAGITDKVLPPWTPVEAKGKVIKCWGREYEFRDMPFPSQIRILNENILVKPIVIEIKNKNRTIQFKKSRIKLLKRYGQKVVFGFYMDGGVVRLKGKIEIEYDGMVKIDFSLIPEKIEPIDTFNIIIPIKKNLCSLFHFWPGQWGSSYNSGQIPEKGFKIPFKPFIWLGNESSGLSWFSETDQNWLIQNPERVIEVNPQDKVTRLKINIIDKSFILKKELRYVFGLQATPVKPFPKDWHEHHIVHVAYYGMERQSWRGSGLIKLKYPASGNININQGTVEFWVSPKFAPDSEIYLPPHTPDIETGLRNISHGLYVRKIFTFWLDKERMLGIYWHIPSRALRVYIVDKGDGSKFPVIMSGKIKWQEGKWHHIALSYGRNLKLYADNKLLASLKYRGLFNLEPCNLKEAVLEFGGSEGCDFVIDDIKISDIARESFDLDSPARADRHTLFLDNLNGTHKGIVSGACNFVPGKFGKGLMLCEDRLPKTALEHIKETGVNVLVFHEHWSNIQNYPDSTHDKELRSLVKACHQNGIKLLLYFGYEMSDLAPEWRDYSEKCLIKLPGEPVTLQKGYHRQPEQKAYIVCYNSKWQNFIAHGIKKIIEDYNIDGVYLDGTSEPFACRNYLHGCGYKSANGSYKPTYPVFAVRELMKRLYTICLKRKGMVSVHQSTCNVIPTLAFATSYWDGEQFASLSKGDSLEVLPLGAFRAEFMGRNWGLPAEFLTYTPSIWTVDEALAFTLLHDVSIRPVNIGPMLRKVSLVWKIWSEFGVDRSRWYPYWENQNLVKVSPPCVKVSLYYHPRKKQVLLVASNLENRDISVTLEFKFKILGILKPKRVIDAITDKDIPVKKPRIKLSFNKISMKILIIK